ncbi:acetoacetate--CoA ligase [Ahrensia sp. AH-315-G08]|nr:acetoacetate--CoA ligase [Ahrensia sp. AH-315-G08]
MNDKNTPLWTPGKQRIESSRMTKFARYCEQQFGKKFDDYQALHKWSVDDRESFWSAIWETCAVIGTRGDRVLINADKMPGAKFFPDARLNYAENLLRKTGEDPAIIFHGEDKLQIRMSWDELHALVSRLQQAFAAAGVKKGDRIAAMVPNMPQTVACMLAASSLGAIWSSCSPDFGEQGVLDRFSQIEPVLFVSCDGYWYNGKKIEVAEKLAKITPHLTAKKTIIIPYLGKAEEVADKLHNGISLDKFVSDFAAMKVTFERLPFDHPLYILFSSGTTGVPKCIVHCQGGVLLQLLKEHAYHCNIHPGEKVFYFTTCGWMMWNWLVSALACEATLMLYDGSPFYPDGAAIFDYVEKESINFFGTSAKFIDAVRNEGRRPIDTHDLSSVHTIASTGSPLSPENFEFAYTGIKKDVHLASVSGGTDIAACFVCAVPWNPVYSGEIQGPALGMDVQVWDDDGQAMNSGSGELVCARAFPSMPVKFWNDPHGHKYHSAYFDRFDNIWCHGDFAEWTEQGGMIISGRSDATLNPGGVRIGTAEIYNQVEQMDEVEEGICIGQQWDHDTRVVLFVRLNNGAKLDDDLKSRIKSKIRSGASPRHVPAVIIQVSDIPRTKSGKITELAVRDVVHGRKIKNQEALANPEALLLFENLPELAV